MYSSVLVCSLQEVKATPIRFISDLIVEDSWSHVFMDTLAPRGFVKVGKVRIAPCTVLTCTVGVVIILGFDVAFFSLFVVQVTSVRMQGLLLLVFAKQVHLPFIRNIQSTYTRTGIFGYWVNKQSHVY